ncbi:MAG TPA: hypothetical protein VGL61_05095 [Kofleriaceae bacterium]|jgi:uncharacterized protein YndB with AHSA1/START domain
MTTFSRALIEVTIAAPADEVWHSLRDRERIAQWFGWDSDSLAAEIEFIFSRATYDDGTRTLTFGKGDRFEVEPRGNGCVLRVVRPSPTADHDWEDIFEDVTQGWIAFALQLRFALEHHAADKRRTLFLSGAPKAPSGPLAARALGLPASGAPGTAYAITAATGDALAGQIWHRGRHQAAFTVDGVGDGLLVAMDRAPDAKRPLGHSQVVLTTYGLSDRAFEELAARWRTWWSDRFDTTPPG